MKLYNIFARRESKKTFKYNDFAAHIVLTELLHDQRICLVGGGSNWNERYSEDFDFVIRINRNYLTQGGRVDGIYFAPGLIPVLDDAGHFIAFSAVNKNEEQEWLAYCEYKHTMPIRYFPDCFQYNSMYGGLHEWANILMKEVETQPFTGLFAIKHLLSLPIKELHLTGFDFYMDNGVIPYVRHSHKIFNQISWLKNIIKVDARVTYDEVLKCIINDECKLQEIHTLMLGGHKLEIISKE